MMLEIFFKIIITAIVFIFLVWMWKSHIDVRDTFAKWFKNKVGEQTEWISTRNEYSIYQNGQMVGKIDGEIKEDNGKIIFKTLYDTGLLDKNTSFEYKRIQCKIISVGTFSGIQIGISPKGNAISRDNVLENVICQKIFK